MRYVVFEKRGVFLPRLIGAFVVLLALVLFVAASGRMYDTWDALKKYPDCVAKVGSDTGTEAQFRYMDCKDSLYRITGLQLRGDQAKITTRQFFITLLGPLAELLFWATVFLVGLLLYHMRLAVVRLKGEPVPKKREK